jgi:signal recognition particle subunit SRP54
MGDVLSLIEQAESAFEAGQAEAAAQKMSDGEFTLEDFLEQMQAVRKMGPIANILGMLPGAANMKDQLAAVDEKQLDRVQAIIRGMTPAERADPKIINGSRRLRIANGSGVTVNEVNEMVKNFFEARKQMKQMAGQFGFGAVTRSATRKQAKGRKGKKGAKRPVGRGPARGALPAGLGGMPDLSGLPPSLQQLPPGMDQLPPGFDPSKLKFPKKDG